MSEDKQAGDGESEAAVDRALQRMATFDVQDLKIEAAQAEGASAELPTFSDAKVEALIAASLRVAEIPVPTAEAEAPAEAANAGLGYGRLLLWGGAVVAIAASFLLWQGMRAPSETAAVPERSASSLPAARLELGGTARMLGEVPPVRPYGAGDTFVLRVSFETAPAVAPFVGLVAEDADGDEQQLPFVPRIEAASASGFVSFEGEIAKHLSPGRWTLRVRLGYPPRCSATHDEDCTSLETQVEVVAP